MDLFAAAGVDLGGGRGGRPGRAASIRTLHVPLFNYRAVEAARARAIFEPSEAELAAAASYAKKANGPKFAREKRRPSWRS